MIIKDIRYLITQNKERHILENIDIKIKNGKIKEIGKFDNWDFDASNLIALPGLINSHTHSPMSLFRGLNSEENLFDWLKQITKLEKNLNENKIVRGTTTSIREMIQSGTTTFADMYSYIDIIAKVVENMNITSFLCHGMKDNLDPKNTDKALQKFINYIPNVNKHKKSKITYGLHWTLTCSDTLINMVARTNKTVQMHVAEALEEISRHRRKFGKLPFERLENLGIANKNLIASHCVHTSIKERNIIEENNVNVVYCPSANMKLSDGVCPASQYLERGINVCIGTDSPASSDNLNMFEEMRIGGLLQKVKFGSDSIDSQTLLDMVTVNPSKAFKEPNIGKIEKGCDANIIFIDVNNPTIRPIKKDRLINNLVFSFDGNISYSMVRGRLEKL